MICGDPALRPVPGFSGYFITTEGRVFSARLNTGRQLPVGDPLRELRVRDFRKPRDRIRKIVHLTSSDGKKCVRYVHRLVLLAWMGPPPFDGAECRHLNGDSSDNRLMNLAWGTRQENEDDKERHGTRNRGPMLYNWKRTPEAVVKVIDSFRRLGSVKAVAEETALSRNVVAKILDTAGVERVHYPIVDRGHVAVAS